MVDVAGMFCVGVEVYLGADVNVGITLVAIGVLCDVTVRIGARVFVAVQRTVITGVGLMISGGGWLGAAVDSHCVGVAIVLDS